MTGDDETLTTQDPCPRASFAAAMLAAAVVIPTLVVHWVVTGYAVFAQLVATFLWGLAIAAWAIADREPVPWRAIAGPLAALTLTAVGIAATALRMPTTIGPLVCAAGLLLATGVILATATRVGRGPNADSAEHALCMALAAAAVLGALVGITQLLAPAWVDGFWIARLYAPGRAAGNLLQANHLGSLLIWGLLALLLARERRWMATPLVCALGALLVLGIALTASRGAIIALALLAVWGSVDRRLSTPVRLLLVAAPLMWLAITASMPMWLSNSEAGTAAADLGRSSARRGVTLGALALIAQFPWLGVGWNEFGTAWALAPQVQHDGRIFDHSHNLVLNLLAELGVPLGVAICVGLGLGAWQLWRASNRPQASRDEAEPARTQARFALATLATIGLHSMVEMPLWFAYFLLPTAWIWGSAIGRMESACASPSDDASAGTRARWLLAGVAVAAAAFVAFADFTRALHASLPADHPMPMQERADTGQQSRLFHHFADQLRATRIAEPPLATFRGARHVIVDAELMQAWAQALQREGRTQEAQWVAQRLARMNAPKQGAQAAQAVIGQPPSNLDIALTDFDWQSLR